MRHCIGGGLYERMARQRHGYGYALALPDGERATLWIERDHDLDGAFRLQQLQGPGNTEPSPAMHGVMLGWLGLHRAWPLHRAGAVPRPRIPEHPLPDAWRAPPDGLDFGGLDDDIPF
jgi:hypothetical protein